MGFGYWHSRGAVGDDLGRAPAPRRRGGGVWSRSHRQRATGKAVQVHNRVDRPDAAFSNAASISLPGADPTTRGVRSVAAAERPCRSPSARWPVTSDGKPFGLTELLPVATERAATTSPREVTDPVRSSTANERVIGAMALPRWVAVRARNSRRKAGSRSGARVFTCPLAS